MVPESTVANYGCVKVQEKYELYVMLLHSIDLFSVALFSLDKRVWISIDLAGDLYSQWSETHSIKPHRLHSCL